jgi:RNA polymerase sigma-70 factor (ECF subfamily)
MESTALARPSKRRSSGVSSSPTVQHTQIAYDDEIVLLEQVAAQEQHAFNTLYTRYAPRLRRYLARRLHQPELVDDVLQEVMLVLWQHAERVPNTVSLIAWLYGIARRKAHKAWTRTAMSPLPPTRHEDIDRDEPEGQLLRQEYGRTLSQALEALPLYERTALMLLVRQGYSPQEIAVATGVPASTVRTRMARARQRLRTRIAS